MSHRHLCIIAHGSRRQASNDEVRRLGECVAALRISGVDHVEVAFLEKAAPSVADALARCADLGAREIVVFPYFLAGGTHVAQDIPEAIAGFRNARPDVRVQLTAHLGASEALPRAIVDIASKTLAVA